MRWHARRFLGFLGCQLASVVWALRAAAPVLTRPAHAVPGMGAFLGFDWGALLAVMLLAVLLLYSSLFVGYHLYITATGQTAREHAHSDQVPYLAHLPARARPFDRGLVGQHPIVICHEFTLGDAEHEQWKMTLLHR